jgi:hypothetical protein
MINGDGFESCQDAYSFYVMLKVVCPWQLKLGIIVAKHLDNKQFISLC